MYLVLSLSGIGSGPCFFSGIFCLDLTGSLYLIGPFKTGCCGVAHWKLPIPTNAQFLSFYMQAIVLRPPGPNSIKSNAVCMTVQ